MPQPRKTPRFWMVYRADGGASTYKHASRESANREAARIAALHPESDVFILRAVAGVVAAVTLEPIRVLPPEPAPF